MFVGSLYIRFLLFVVRIRHYRGLRAEVDFCHSMGLYVLGIIVYTFIRGVTVGSLIVVWTKAPNTVPFPLTCTSILPLGSSALVFLRIPEGGEVLEKM